MANCSVSELDDLLSILVLYSVTKKEKLGQHTHPNLEVAADQRRCEKKPLTPEAAACAGTDRWHSTLS